MQMRCIRTVAVVAAITFVMIVRGTALAEQAISEPGAKTAPKTKLDLSKHRNLYNGDFGVFFWNAEMWQPDGGRYTAGAVHRFVDNLADNGVDTFIINPNSQVAWYPSKAIPTVLDRYVRDDPAVDDKKWVWWCHDLLNPALDLKEAGVDCLAEAIKQCRKRGITPWASIRMNDPHLNHPYLQCHLHNSKYRLGYGLNYEHKEVRDYYFSLARELVEDYDFDGLELDWLRCPGRCCKSPADAKTVAMMSRWFADIRRLTEAKAKRTGRPFPLGMRIPADYKGMRSVGIDVEGLIKGGTLDYICPTNFMQTTWDMPHDELKKEFGRYVTIYGVTELLVNGLDVWSDKLNRGIQSYNNASPPALRGNAAGKLALGADGIQQYNFFVGDQTCKIHKVPGLRSQCAALKNIADLDVLRGLSKHYSICSGPPGTGGERFDLPKPLPAAIEPGKRLDLKLPMCAEPDDRGLDLIVQVVFEKQEPLPPIAVRFNRSVPRHDAEPTMKLLFPMGPAKRHLSKYQACNYRFPVDRIKEGWNMIVLANTGNKPVGIVGVELAVK